MESFVLTYRRQNDMAFVQEVVRLVVMEHAPAIVV